MSVMVRLSKIMSERGLASRREADEWIQKGWVKVDGQVVSELGVRVSPDCQIELLKQAQKEKSELVTIILNKPIGFVSAQPEDGYEPAIRLITQENQYVNDSKEDNLGKKLKSSHFKGLAVAGRLDIDSQGLLVLTQDGVLARKLIGDNSRVEKEYLVRVQGQLSAENLKLLQIGLSLDGKPLRQAKVEWVNSDQLRFVLTEGRKRQVRRMCELVGLRVIGLKRVRIGKIRLGRLPEGQWRFLEKHEIF